MSLRTVVAGIPQATAYTTGVVLALAAGYTVLGYGRLVLAGVLMLAAASALAIAVLLAVGGGPRW